MTKKRKDIKWFFACEKEWYLRWWLWIIIIIVISLIPLGINEAYKYGYSTGKGYYTLWEAKDVLAFYGSFLTCIGTVLLGALALKQNKVFKEENEKLNKKLMQAQIFNSCAFYKIEGCHIKLQPEKLALNLFIKNIGKSVAINTLPYEFEFSKYGYQCPNNTKDVIKQYFDKTYANTDTNNIINFNIEFEPNFCFENDIFYYAHITMSILTENQLQYDQIIRMNFQFKHGQLHYIGEYPLSLNLYQ